MWARRTSDEPDSPLRGSGFSVVIYFNLLYNLLTMSKGEPTPRWGELFRDSDPTPRQRLPYGAVPLEPWGATFYHRAQPYWNSSMNSIYRKLQTTMVDQDWFRHDSRSYHLHDLMEVSLRESHQARVKHNADVDLGVISKPDDPRLEYAKTGIATPAELFTLLADNTQLGSLELAKLSHPFDFEATREMDEAIEDLMLSVEGEILDANPRYKVKRTDSRLPAAVVLRKQDMMDFPVDEWGGKVRIVRRQGFLVFDGEDAQGWPQLEHLVRPKFEANRDAIIGARVEPYLGEHPHGRPYGWVQPQASSYYAKYIPGPPVSI